MVIIASFGVYHSIPACIRLTSSPTKAVLISRVHCEAHGPVGRDKFYERVVLGGDDVQSPLERHVVAGGVLFPGNPAPEARHVDRGHGNLDAIFRCALT